MKMSGFAHLLVLVLVIAACEAKPAIVATPPITRDSAGIHIVENNTPQWTEQTKWRLSREPVIVIATGDRIEEGPLKFRRFHCRPRFRRRSDLHP
jgi:hypothetical protein